MDYSTYDFSQGPSDHVDKAVMELMTLMTDKIQDILISDEYKEYKAVLLKENVPCPMELVFVEALMQMVEHQYKWFEKDTGYKMPKELSPRTMVKKYLQNPDIYFSKRWRLYRKEDLN